ncbi:MAG TPA: hypothetical protein VGF55_00320 [Gemmataceae bacterium]
MDSFGIADLRELVAERPGPCVSLFFPVKPGQERDAVGWKALLRTARRRLKAVGVPAQEADDLLRPATELSDDPRVWQAEGTGLACYAAPGYTHHYRLGLTWPRRAAVGRVFDVRPVLPWLVHGRRFYVLALSQNVVRLLRGTFDGPVHVDLPGPANRAEALRAHDSDEMSFAHTFVGGTGSRRRAAFHGHGVGSDDAKDDLLLYFRAVDRALEPVLQGERAPLVVAAVDYLLPLFRQACRYPHLFPAAVVGNPDQVSDWRLADAARDLIEPGLGRAAHDAVATYRQLAGTGRTTHDTAEIVAAAFRGEIEFVCLAAGRDVWGRFDPATGGAVVYVDHEPDDDELTNLAAVFALRHGRPVHVLPPDDMPDGAAVVAVSPLPLAKHGKRR